MSEPDPVVERFSPTSGRITGILGLATAGVVLVASLWAGSVHTALGMVILAALGGVLVWAVLLRPSVAVSTEDLVLRGILRTDRIPLAAIDTVVVSQVFAVFAGGRRYVSPAIGHPTREVLGGSRRPGGVHQEFAESRVRHLAQERRDWLGIREGSPEQAALAAEVRRTWAWPEIVAVVVLAVAFAIWLALP